MKVGSGDKQQEVHRRNNRTQRARTQRAGSSSVGAGPAADSTPTESERDGGGSALVEEQGSRGSRGSERLGAPSASVERRLSSVASMTSLPEEGARGPETSVEDDSVARL